MIIALGKHVRRISFRTAGISVIAVGLLAYLVVIPTVESVVEQYKERPASYVVEDLTVWEILRIRSAKLVVFTIFAYVGACIGSFLNVVATSAPRGEPIALRTSACPECGTPIRRIDNIPIFSYLRLQGRCRACSVPIPIRYLAVEVLGLVLMGSLFLYELVSGASNIPNFRHYTYTGIVWIILYTKWPVVGIYLYHVFMFFLLLVFALMEVDQQRCPPWFAIITIGAFALLGIAIPVLQPVAFDDYLPPGLAGGLPPLVNRIITCVAGGVLGWVVAKFAQGCGVQPAPANGLILLGVALGWQAALTIGLLWGTAYALVRLLVRTRGDWLSPTAILFAVAMLHHPAWKTLSNAWRSLL